MSYCRFSSENFGSDVYVYESCYGGWTTHVASRRRVIPPIPDLPLSLSFKPPRFYFSIWSWWHKHLHLRSLDLIPLRPIGLPHDGDGFGDDTPGACADRLESLRAMGYRVPQYAIDALRREQAEGYTSESASEV